MFRLGVSLDAGKGRISIVHYVCVVACLILELLVFIFRLGVIIRCFFLCLWFILIFLEDYQKVKHGGYEYMSGRWPVYCV